MRRRGPVHYGEPRPRHLAEFDPVMWPLCLDESDAWRQWLDARRVFAAAYPERWPLDVVDNAREVRRERIRWRDRRNASAAASADRYRPAAEGGPQ